VLPVSAIFSRLLDFIIAFIVLIVMLFYFKIVPGWQIIFLPILILILLFTSLGLGLILSAMAIQYRDIKYAMTFMVQLLIYAAPVVYSTFSIPEKWRMYYILNPMVGVIEGFRAAFLNQSMPWKWIWPGAIVSLTLFIIGLFYFRKMEKVFADVA
jgi:lipopolysaccharide transport system permease protein